MTSLEDTGPSEKDAAAFCADLVRNRDRARYVADLLTPVEHRRALSALHAFNVEVTDVAIHVSQPMAGEIRLQWWHDMLSGDDHGDVAANPVAAELRRAIERYALPIEPLLNLVNAHQRDLYADPMASLSELHTYCDDTAGELFNAAALILGASSESAHALAHSAGMAQGLTAIMAALPAHAARSQIYLPADMLSAFAVKPEDILGRRTTPQLEALLSELRDQARAHLDATEAALTDQPASIRAGFLTLALTRAMLDALAKGKADPFKPVVLSPLRTFWLLWRASRRLR
jgi:phytoene synthase